MDTTTKGQTRQDGHAGHAGHAGNARQVGQAGHEHDTSTSTCTRARAHEHLYTSTARAVGSHVRGSRLLPCVRHFAAGPHRPGWPGLEHLQALNAGVESIDVQLRDRNATWRPSRPCPIRTSLSGCSGTGYPPPPGFPVETPAGSRGEIKWRHREWSHHNCNQEMTAGRLHWFGHLFGAAVFNGHAPCSRGRPAWRRPLGCTRQPLQHRKQRYQSMAEWQRKRKERQSLYRTGSLSVSLSVPHGVGAGASKAELILPRRCGAARVQSARRLLMQGRSPQLLRSHNHGHFAHLWSGSAHRRPSHTRRTWGRGRAPAMDCT